MTGPTEPGDDHSFAANAAGAGEWFVGPDRQVMEIRSTSEIVPPNLVGRWAVEEFAREIDGLHRAEFLELLNQPDARGHIDLSVHLANGGAAHFRGRLCEDGAVRGLVLLPVHHGEPTAAHIVQAVYQPIVRLRDGGVAGHECLARIRQPDGSLIRVDSLHPVMNIGPNMARQAIDALKSRQSDHHFLNLNFSACELSDLKSVSAIAGMIANADLPQRMLRIEITEQAAVRDWSEIRRGIAILRDAGAGIVLDDFGAGHSSMIWLSELEVDGVKLDAAFLDQLATDRGRLILQRLLSLLADLQVEAVIEGIEDQNLIPQLIAMGGDLGQGFALGSPATEPRIDAPGPAG